MVHQLYILNPTHKLRAIFNLVFRGSKSFLREVNNTTSQFNSSAAPTEPAVVIIPPSYRPKINVADLIKTDFPPIAQDTSLKHDNKFYRDEAEGGFCIFRAENTLFKVHKCFLLREPSAFGDMFSLPFIPGSYEGLSDEAAIPLSDKAAEFQDLLWALYAVPTQLTNGIGADSPSLERVINIAHLANKYGIVSYETWALERLLELAQVGVLRNASPELCARALNIAALCDYDTLLDTIIRRLVPRILWSDMNCQAILQVAQDRGLRKVMGVIYYKELIDLENASSENRKANRHIFPTEWPAEKRARFLAAHRSLVNLWESVRTTPPCFFESGCQAHVECLTTWTELWLAAASSPQTTRHASSDVLGRLKAMMIILKKSMSELHPIALECTLSALESITILRDDITVNLMDHFQSES